MVQATPSQQAVWTLLYDKQDTSTPASGAIQNIGEEDNSELKLLKNEVAEITHIEIESPLATDGTAEALEYIRPVIDGKDYQGGDMLRFRADLDSNVLPPRANIDQELHAGEFGSRTIYTLGLGLPELVALGIEQNPSMIIKNTTIKVREAGKINFKTEVGNSSVTDNYRVRAYGWKYTDLGVADRYARLAYAGGRRVTWVDPRNGRDFSFNVIPNYRTAKNDWTRLLGGNDQDLRGGVDVTLFNYYARNAKSTTASKDYVYSFDDGNVDNREEDMDLEVDDKTVWRVERLGINDYSGNLLDIKIEANDVEVFRERKRDSIHALEYGRTTGPNAQAEPSDHKWKPLPHIPVVYGHNETLKAIAQDSGTVIGDGSNIQNGLQIVWAGVKVQDPNFQVGRPTRL